jgi:hypothetical protein
LNWLLGCRLDQPWLVELEMVDLRRHRMTDHPSLRIGLQEPTRLGYARPEPSIVIFAAQDRGHPARRIVDFGQQRIGRHCHERAALDDIVIVGHVCTALRFTFGKIGK